MSLLTMKIKSFFDPVRGRTEIEIEIEIGERDRRKTRVPLVESRPKERDR